ncbi:hypothetical protein BJ875DRAFT_421959 [Amylocarpus encephaloides]|uniref:Uncharacterized protein n=1 Tax=Amylocarpus encephaloides TaxID=45428 RepID=A0A9P7YKP6_9HELO|nr:hypothetical protein BJ875DRAFT_421959 [Amylocarpus encephaloides]
MLPPTNRQITTAYRHLYRASLQAIKYSKPARFAVRDQLRSSFRMEDIKSFDQQKIDNTVEFLGYAARESGIEHKILRNMLMVKIWEKHNPSRDFKDAMRSQTVKMRKSAMINYNMTLAMLNDSMGICLR